LKPTVLEYLKKITALFGETTPADGYALKNQYRNLASFSFFFFLTCGD
jgi:hypothetical protein